MSVSCFSSSASNVHHIASQGFSQVTSEYEKGRPSYPIECYDLIDTMWESLQDRDTPKQDFNMVDVGAGTGKWTSMLKSYFESIRNDDHVTIHCVEPMENFRNVLEEKYINISSNSNNLSFKIHNGTANDLSTIFPMSNSIDAIFAGQAFHWFANKETLDQFSDVLVDGGWLYFIWNMQIYDIFKENRDLYKNLNDNDGKFLKELKSDIVNLYHDEKDKEVINYKAMKNDILQLINQHGSFGNNNNYITFNNSLSQIGNVDVVINRILSKSTFGRRNEQEKANVVKMIQDLVCKYYGNLQYDKICMPYDTDVLMFQVKK